VSNYSSRAGRLEVICEHYLGLEQGLRESSGRQVIWPCPSCGEGSFVASFEEGVVGCVEEGCGISSAMGIVELIAYLDKGVEKGDERAAMDKAGQILEAAARQEHEHQEERREDKRRAAEQRRWQRELARARSRESGHPQETLFR
jgi:hypothetical protein